MPQVRRARFRGVKESQWGRSSFLTKELRPLSPFLKTPNIAKHLHQRHNHACCRQSERFGPPPRAGHRHLPPALAAAYPGEAQSGRSAFLKKELRPL